MNESLLAEQPLCLAHGAICQSCFEFIDSSWQRSLGFVDSSYCPIHTFLWWLLKATFSKYELFLSRTTSPQEFTWNDCDNHIFFSETCSSDWELSDSVSQWDYRGRFEVCSSHFWFSCCCCFQECWGRCESNLKEVWEECSYHLNTAKPQIVHEPQQRNKLLLKEVLVNCGGPASPSLLKAHLGSTVLSFIPKLYHFLFLLISH